MNFKNLLIIMAILILAVTATASVVSAGAVETITPSQNITSGIDLTDNGGTLILFNGTYDKLGDRNITIDKNITIQGQGKVILDAKNMSRHFTIATNTNVVFINITFINGNAPYTLNTTNPSYTSIRNGTGGSIMMEEDWDDIYDPITHKTTFIDNSNSSLKIYNCIFINNQAINGGGAIWATGNFYVEGCIFDGNFITDTGFISTYNYQARDGGAIYFEGAKAYITDSKFNNNFIENTTTSYACNGGAIALMIGDMTVNNCNFTNNSASDGGAIDKTWWIGANLTVLGSKFVDNIAYYQGGAICSGWNSNHDWSITIIDNCTFYNNSAHIGGAVIWYGGSSSGSSDSSGWLHECWILNSYFEGNEVWGTGWTRTDGTYYYEAGHGGAILTSQGSDVNIINNTFVKNIADKGSAIGSEGHNTVNILNNTFLDNIAKMTGTLQLYGGYGGVTDFYVIGNNFVNNTADDGADIIGGTRLNSLIFNYNRIISNGIYINSSVNDSASINIDLKLNWWGSNKDPNDKISINKFTGYNDPNDEQLDIHADNWVLVNVTPVTDLSGKIVNFTYTIKLSDNNAPFDVNKLPNFNGNGITSLGGNTISYNAKLDQLLTLTNTVSGEATYTFTIDNQVFTFVGNVVIPNDDIIPDDDSNTIPDKDPVKNDTNKTPNPKPEPKPPVVIDGDKLNTAQAGMKETGLPIITMLLILLFSCISIRRFK